MADPFKHTRDLRRAFGLISGLRTSVPWLPERGAQVAGWFPFVGLTLGLVVWVPLVIADDVLELPMRVPPGVLAAAIMIVWGLLTRLLHWDGLADVADAYWGSEDRERRLEIMKDSRTGAFGVAAVVGVALLEFACLSALLAPGWDSPILWAATVARLAATFAAWLGKPARPGGLGAAVCGKPKVPAVIAAALALALAATPLILKHPAQSIAPIVAGIAFALVVPHLISERFGGVTGDVMGASVLVTEALTLMVAVIALAVVGG